MKLIALVAALSVSAAAVLLAGNAPAASAAQPPDRRSDFGPRTPPPDIGRREGYDGRFRFCRVRFRNSPWGEGHGWYVDYPRADENLSIRLAEITRAPVVLDDRGNHLPVVVRLTDPELFRCPFAMMSEPGGAAFDEREAAQLRLYLLKGGFLWADDFWGSDAWRSWSAQLGEVLSPAIYPIVDLPMDHVIFRMLFGIERVPQIPNVGLWLGSQLTSERGRDSAEAHARAILDEAGRIMVFMTFNTDFGDAYERESESPDYFRRFSIEAYAIGVNVLLYAFTH